MTNKNLSSVDSKEIVSHFYKAINQMADGQFGRHVITAKQMLLKYSKEEILLAIDYCAKRPPAGGMYSLAFVAVNIDKIIAPIRKQKAQIRVTKELNKVTDFGKLPEKSDYGKKLERFGVKNEFTWTD